jgi:colanic acid biosynthesis glycosyl transferase WcaI
VRVFSPRDRTRLGPRLLSFASFDVNAFLKAVTRARHDVVLIPSPPLTNGLIGSLITRLRGTPFVYNVQDIWPDVLIRAGLSNRPAIAVLKWMERKVYRDAAGIAVIGDGFRRNLLEKGVPDHRIRVIPNFFDTDFVQPGERQNAFRSAHGFGDRFVVMFAGNVGYSQGLDSVLDAAETLQSDPDFVFAIVGSGASKESLEQSARERALSNVRFLPFQPHEALPEMYAASDVHLVPLRHGFTNESVPCKVFTIMSSGRPFVAGVDADSETWRLVETSGAGVNVPPEDPAALAAALRRLRADERLRREMGAAGRAYAERYHTREAIAREYEDLLQRVAARKPVVTIGAPLEAR